MSTPTNQGWQCPCCETVYAPHVSSCKCKKLVSIKPQQPLTDNDKINQEARLREKWKKMMEEMGKYPHPNDSIKPNPIPQWPATPFHPSPPQWWEVTYTLNAPFVITCTEPALLR